MDLCFELLLELNEISVSYICYSLLFCSGLTHSNYKELNVLYEKYKDKGKKFILARQYHKFSYLQFFPSKYPKKIGILKFYIFAGFEILAFPCNQFAGQEPGNNDEIEEVACTMFKAEFPIFDKVSNNMHSCIRICMYYFEYCNCSYFSDQFHL